MERYAELNRGLWDRPDRLRLQRNLFGRAVLGEGKSILEIGCAAGEGGPVLAPGNRLVGLDVVEDYVRRLGRDYAGRVAASAVHLPFGEGRFDGLFAAEFIEHLGEADGAVFLREAARVLRRGGLLLLTTPNPSYWRTRLFNIRISGGPHLKVYPPVELERSLVAAGFEIAGRRGLGRMAFLLGQRFPLVCYGDYGVVARRG
jgi:SAM-dependent methyltransferase